MLPCMAKSQRKIEYAVFLKLVLFWNLFPTVILWKWTPKCCIKQTLYACKSWYFYRNLSKCSIPSLWKWVSPNGKIYNLRTLFGKHTSISSADKTWRHELFLPFDLELHLQIYSLKFLYFDTNLSIVTTIHYISFSSKVKIFKPEW